MKWAQKSAAKGQAHLDEKSAKCSNLVPAKLSPKDRSKFEVHWHCVLADPDNIGWRKFMNDVEEMVRNNDGRGFCQVINDCDALDELFLAERSGVAAFGAAALWWRGQRN